MALHIEGPEAGVLSDAIKAAVNPPALEQVLKYKLNDDIYAYDEGKGYNQTRFKLIEQYNARYHIDRLVSALLEHVPDNAKIVDFARRYQILKGPAGEDALERMLDPVRGFSDAGSLLQRLGQIVHSICQITVPTAEGTEYGTGFLIGDETVLTNWHVVEKVTPLNRKNVKLLFDYRTGPDGQVIADAMPCNLVDNEKWLLDSSPYHADDLTARPIDQIIAATRPVDHLDYAVLRVAGSPGKKPIGAKASPDGPPRGCLKLQDANTDDAVNFAKAQAAMFLFQHPFENGRSLPLQYDFNKPAILGVNQNQTRVLYDINTRPGSSGSPCFNAKLELVALHHAGGKDWPKPKDCLYNQGIPIGKIRSLLEQRGKLAEIK